jgi:heme/copper-type cytochrome/quinol oxidase subunit 4
MVLPSVIFFSISGFFSAWLCLGIAYLMFRSWRTVQSEYLIGFPIGFSLLALAYVISDLALAYPLSSSVDSVRLVVTTVGFAFLCMTYFLRMRTGSDNPISSGIVRSILGLMLVILVFAVALASAAFIPLNWTSQILFPVINLGLIGYIIYSLNRALTKEVELSTIVLGFTFLAIEQCSLLLWTLDRAFLWALVFSQLTRLAGLAALLIFLVRGFERM